MVESSLLDISLFYQNITKKLILRVYSEGSIISVGPFAIFDFHQYRVKYSENDLNEDGFFYVDLEDFKQKRVTRDYYRGTGMNADDNI
jgi:hypothetical protein